MEEFLAQLIGELFRGLCEAVGECVAAGVIDVVARLFEWCWRFVMWLGGAVFPGITLEDRLVRLGANAVVAAIVYGLFWR